MSGSWPASWRMSTSRSDSRYSCSTQSVRKRASTGPELNSLYHVHHVHHADYEGYVDYVDDAGNVDKVDVNVVRFNERASLVDSVSPVLVEAVHQQAGLAASKHSSLIAYSQQYLRGVTQQQPRYFFLLLC